MAERISANGNDDDVITQTATASSNPTSATEKLADSPPYDLLLTVESASHVAVGDIHGKSDVYIIGKLKNVKGLVPHNPKSSRIHFRTSTKRSTRDPEWNEKWRFGGVREGTYLKLKLFDEDPRKKLDDKLGSLKIEFTDLKNTLLDGKEHTRNVPIRGYKGKKHIQLLTGVFDLCNPEARKADPEPHVTIKLQLLPAQNSEILNIHLQNPTRYSVHSSPLFSLLATTPSRKQAAGTQTAQTQAQATTDASQAVTPKEETSFKSYKVSLIHPPPFKGLQFEADEQHARAFDTSKLRYRMFRHLVKKQYQNLYGHDNKTEYGGWWDGEDVGPGLVDLLKPVEDKLFTFVVTINGEWRFCETGDEYKINHLSKHGMHSNVQKKVAWSGEFFIRRSGTNESKEVEKFIDEETGIKQAERYTIYLDNDSGTYSPSKEKISEFRKFMAGNLRGMDVVVKDFKDGWLDKAKQEQKGKTAENNDEEKQEQQEKVENPEEPKKLLDVLDEEHKRRLTEESGGEQKGRGTDLNLL